MCIVTGIAFLAMAWLEPAGPLFILVGAGLCAVAAEGWLDRAGEAADWTPPARTDLRSHERAA